MTQQQKAEHLQKIRGLYKIQIKDEKNVAKLEEMFQDELPPEAKELEVDEAITNKESTKDSDYEKYTKKALDQLANIKDWRFTN